MPAERDLKFARGWLYRELRSSETGRPAEVLRRVVFVPVVHAAALGAAGIAADGVWGLRGSERPTFQAEA